jgi:hypothetical protein
VETELSNSLYSAGVPMSFKPFELKQGYEITAMGSNYKDSHIGNYYEYGTGEKAVLPPTGMYLGDRNPFRSGATIVSRSYSQGPWKDMGGNARYSGGRGGINTPEFRSYIGEDIEAYRWFQDAFEKNRAFAFDEYRKAWKTVDFKKFFTVNKKIVLGKKKG